MGRQPRGARALPQESLFRLTALRLASALVLLAAGFFTATHAHAATTWRHVSDDELRSTWARGFTDRLFDGRSLYLANGNAVTVLGDLATLLNPVLAFVDADTSFGKVSFNPANMGTIVDQNGTAVTRLTTYIADASVQNIRVAGSSHPSVGSVFIHGIDLRGTTVRVVRTP